MAWLAAGTASAASYARIPQIAPPPRHRRDGPHRRIATRAQGPLYVHGGVGHRPPGEQGADQLGALAEAPFLGG
jgi:hypothetical protein